MCNITRDGRLQAVEFAASRIAASTRLRCQSTHGIVVNGLGVSAVACDSLPHVSCTIYVYVCSSDLYLRAALPGSGMCTYVLFAWARLFGVKR